jgi:hypothetical protein
MKLRILKVDDKTKEHFTVDYAKVFCWLIILLLCWSGFFPWWVVLYYPLASFGGITMRVRLEK